MVLLNIKWPRPSLLLLSTNVTDSRAKVLQCIAPIGSRTAQHNRKFRIISNVVKESPGQKDSLLTFLNLAASINKLSRRDLCIWEDYVLL